MPESPENPKSTIEKTEVDIEKETWDKLDELLEDPENAFLFEHDVNRIAIEEAPTALEALKIANDLIDKRLEATFKLSVLGNVEGVEPISINIEGVRKVLESIQANQEKIGEGGDAIVVIHKEESELFGAEICYKIAKAKAQMEGRNPTLVEAEVQEEFFREMQEYTDLCIRAPEPLYAIKYGKYEMIGMEVLQAVSVKDIVNGKGYISSWFNVDAFCDQLQELLNRLHSNHKYHRDLHRGNIMIHQSETEPEDGKWGYVIDFGYSGYAILGSDPYKRDVGDKTFTFLKDDDIVSNLRETLNRYGNAN